MPFGLFGSRTIVSRTFRRASLLVLTWLIITLFLFGMTGASRVKAEESHDIIIKGISYDPAVEMPDEVNLADEVAFGGASTAAGNQNLRPNRSVTNLQVNDPNLDHSVIFPNFRPFEFSTQSETSIASFGRNVVVGYNSSANQTVVQVNPTTLQFTKRFLSGYSYSHDGGKTWQSAFIPASPGSSNTFGDPALGVDRQGNFYYASLGADAVGNTTITTSKSSDSGTTFGPAVIVTTDNGGDKEWLAVGPDPVQTDRDNLYVTWTSFGGNGSTLHIGKSTDGGATWSTKLLYAPVPGPNLGGAIQFSNPVVDPFNGRLYVPFLDFSNFQYDFIRVLVSDDGGNTFHFLNFNIPGAADPTYLPNTTPGTISDCGSSGGIRQILHSGPVVATGRGGFPIYQNATRLVTQPAMAAANGRLFIALQDSINEVTGDPGAGSFIRLFYSPDAGNSWNAPVIVAPSTSADPQHVHPAISIDRGGEHVAVSYYVQQADEKLRVDLANGQVKGKKVVFDDTVTHLSNVAFSLTPSNILLGFAGSTPVTTNYDRSIRPCYDIGEYQGLTRPLTIDGIQGNSALLAAWGDNRNSWSGPTNNNVPSPAPGPHPQPDVFFARGDN